MTAVAETGGRLSVAADDYLGETPVWSTIEQALYWVNCEDPPRIRQISLEALPGQVPRNERVDVGLEGSRRAGQRERASRQIMQQAGIGKIGATGRDRHGKTV